MVRAFIVSMCPALLAGCSGSTVVDVRDYNRSCGSDDECVVVQDGDICCGCPNAAINKSDLEDYRDDLGTCSSVCDIGCVGDLEPFCNAGLCDVRPVAGELCEPGSAAFCKCDSGASGTRTCAPDGASFGPCECG